MSALLAWFRGTTPTGDLVDQMHNAAGAFHKGLTPCPCTGQIEVGRFRAQFGVPAKYWVYCHGCCTRSPAKPSIGEAAYEWNAGARADLTPRNKP